MKYSATLNGKQYEVELERVDEYAPIPRGGVAAAAPTAPITSPAVKAAPAAPAPAPAPAPAAAGGEGSVVIESPMPGKILAIKAQPGTAVTAGQVILVLEAMKMENEIVAPQAGTVASVNVAVGEMVEPGAKLATMN